MQITQVRGSPFHLRYCVRMTIDPYRNWPRPRHLRTDLAPHLVSVPIGIYRLSVRTRNAAMMFIARRSGGIPAIVSGRRAQADFWPEMTFELLVTQPESVTCYSPS
jgi:hypothetical protein